MPDSALGSTDEIRPLKWTSGVDWFRWRCEERDASDDLQRVAEAIQAQDVAEGERAKKFAFDGCTGKRTPRVRWARSKSLTYVETSGEWCDTTWRLLPLSTGRLTRLDLQSTWTLSQPEPSFGMQSMLLEGMTRPPRLPNGMPRGLHLYQDGGWHGTVADRTAPEHFRLYDKGIQTRDHRAGVQWRLELEVKYRHAAEMGVRCLELLKDPTWCARYAISRWLHLGLCLPLPVDEQSLAAVRPSGRPQPTLEAQREWIRRTVSPVMSRMLMTTPVDELLTLLALDRHAVPRTELDDCRELLRRCAADRLALAGQLSLLDNGAVGQDAPRAHGGSASL